MNLGFENEETEFKESTSEKEEALKDICAMLNKRGKGVLYFGVKNNGDVCGMPVGPKTESDFSSKISQSIEPIPYFSISTKMDVDNHAFLEVTFNGQNIPYKYKGIYYLRNGERSEIMPSFLLEKMIREKQKDYSKWENSSAEISIDDLDMNLLAKVIRSGKENNKIRIESNDNREILKQFHLLTKDGEINKACEALFSRYEPYCVRLSLLAGFDSEHYLDMTRTYGNLFQLIDESYQYVISRLNYAPVLLEGSTQRETKPEIPLNAIREIIVNMFAHADYSSPIEHRISIYKNRIEFLNPGFFPPATTPEEFANKEIDPIDRNGKILKTLFAANYIEHFGTGFTTIFKAFRENRISYEYGDTKSGFCFTVYRKGNIDPCENMDIYRRILSIIRQDNYLKIDELVKITGKSRASITRYLKELQDQKKLSKEGSKKETKWIVH